MWRSAAVVVVVSALMSPTTALGLNRTFGDWAKDQGYSPGDVMPEWVNVTRTPAAIDSLHGISEFSWTDTPTATLSMQHNQISSIEPDTFGKLTNLTRLDLRGNQISSIEPGTFGGLTNLTRLHLWHNQISSIDGGDFSGLTNLTRLHLRENQISNIESEAFIGLRSLSWLELSGNQISSIEPGTFGGLTSLTAIELQYNQLSSIESGVFSGLTNLNVLRLSGNQLSSIEAGTFSGLASLTELHLGNNVDLTELNLADADFSNLDTFDVDDNVHITIVSLKNAVLNQTSLAALLDGGRAPSLIGMGELDGIAEMDFSGVDFADMTDLVPLYVMDDLTDLWLVDTLNLDATALDALLDNLEIIEGTDTEGIVHMTAADFDAFNTAGGGLLAAWDAEPGHHVAFVIPEPSTLLICLVALGVVGGWRKWGG
jgi:uncharacterized protein YjbI with pentapeptide repeats